MDRTIVTTIGQSIRIAQLALINSPTIHVAIAESRTTALHCWRWRAAMRTITRTAGIGGLCPRGCIPIDGRQLVQEADELIGSGT